MTRDKPRNHSIVVQVVKNAKTAPETVAGPILVPEDGSGGLTVAKIKQELKDSLAARRPLR